MWVLQIVVCYIPRVCIVLHAHRGQCKTVSERKLKKNRTFSQLLGGLFHQISNQCGIAVDLGKICCENLEVLRTGVVIQYFIIVAERWFYLPSLWHSRIAMDRGSWFGKPALCDETPTESVSSPSQLFSGSHTNPWKSQSKHVAVCRVNVLSGKLNPDSAVIGAFKASP